MSLTINGAISTQTTRYIAYSRLAPLLTDTQRSQLAAALEEAPDRLGEYDLSSVIWELEQQRADAQLIDALVDVQAAHQCYLLRTI